MNKKTSARYPNFGRGYQHKAVGEKRASSLTSDCKISHLQSQGEMPDWKQEMIKNMH